MLDWPAIQVRSWLSSSPKSLTVSTSMSNEWLIIKGFFVAFWQDLDNLLAVFKLRFYFLRKPDSQFLQDQPFKILKLNLCWAFYISLMFTYVTISFISFNVAANLSCQSNSFNNSSLTINTAFQPFIPTSLPRDSCAACSCKTVFRIVNSLGSMRKGVP